MNLYIILVRHGHNGWTPSLTFFETREDAEVWARGVYPTEDWRVVLVPTVRF
jgi:hypothetical protein